jgi:hypothetical protein
MNINDLRKLVKIPGFIDEPIWADGRPKEKAGRKDEINETSDLLCKYKLTVQPNREN